jgi:hypothetical protein
LHLCPEPELTLIVSNVTPKWKPNDRSVAASAIALVVGVLVAFMVPRRRAMALEPVSV